MEDLSAPLDLCNEVIKKMQIMGFSQSQIQTFTQNENYQIAVGQTPKVQRVYLTLALSNILNKGPSVVPAQIRIGLNMALNEKDWVTDIGLIVLPFIKANDEVLLP